MYRIVERLTLPLAMAIAFGSSWSNIVVGQDKPAAFAAGDEVVVSLKDQKYVGKVTQYLPVVEAVFVEFHVMGVKQSSVFAAENVSKVKDLPAFAIGDQVTIPLDTGGMPSDIGLGTQQRAEVAFVDGPFLDVKYVWNGKETRERVLAAFVRSARRSEFESGRLKGHTAEVTGVSFFQDGTTLASISPSKGDVTIWDLKTMSFKDGFSLKRGGQVRTGQYGAIALIPGGGMAVQIDKNLFFLADAANVLKVVDWPNQVFSFSISPDGRSLATIEPAEKNSEGHTVFVAMFAVKDVLSNVQDIGYSKLDLKSNAASTYRIVFSEKGDFVVIACRPRDNTSKSELTLWSPVEMWNKQGPALPELAGDALALGYDAKDATPPRIPLLVHGNQLCELIYNAFFDPIQLDEPTIKVRAQLSGMTDAAGRNMTCAAFAPDNRWLVTAHRGGELMFFDTKDGKQLASFPTSASDVRALAVAPDGQSIATSDGAEIVIWSVSKILPQAGSK